MELLNNIKLYLNKLSDLPPLFFRLILAFGFYKPAITKFNNFDNIVGWFGSIGIPFPTLNAFLATGIELAGFILLFLGLATRIISFPLIIVMIVAITTVHLGNGFEAGDNGFEIPIYYILMLFSLIVTGPGKFSLDHLVGKYLKKNSYQSAVDINI